MNRQLSEKNVKKLLEHELGSDTECESTSEIKTEYEDDNSDWESEEEISLPEVRATQDYTENSKNNVSSKRSGKEPPAASADYIPGPSAQMCKPAMSPLYYFKLLITPTILDIIIYITNLEMMQRRKVQLQALDKINLEELEAYLGLLILAAAHKCNHLSAEELFSHPALGLMYQAAMSFERFQILTDCLRFDFIRKINANEPKKVHPVTSIIWDKFINQCQECYVPSKNCIITEKELGTASCHPLLHKPNIFNMKMVMLCDADTNYVIDAMTYFGKNELNKKAKYCANKIMCTINETNRNVIMDTRFSDIQVMKKMLEKNTTTLCVLKKHPPEVPVVDAQNSPVVMFNDMIFTTIKSPNRVVTVASSSPDFWRTEICSSFTTQQEDIIKAYNIAMGSLELSDQLYHNMNIYRKTDRWQTCFFYNMLSLAVVNACILHNARVEKDSRLSCFEFMIQLQKQLTKEWLWKRYDNTVLRHNIHRVIANVLKPNRDQHKTDCNLGEKCGPRALCHVCHYATKRSTVTYCMKCSRPICAEHQQKTCVEC